MTAFLKSGRDFVRTGWFWAFVLLAVPNCAFDSTGFCDDPQDNCENETPKPPECKEGDPECDPDPPCEGPECPPEPCEEPDPMCPPDPCPGPDCPPVEQFETGTAPISDKLLCEIREPVEKLVDSCATPADIANAMILGMPQGATALATGKGSTIALDWSDNAKAICGGGPLKVTFLGGGKFPDGSEVCINATQQIPMVYATPEKACRVKCQDLINFGTGFKPADVAQYCIDNTRVATNYSLADFANACTPGGTPDPNFPDPRKLPEPVKWTDQTGTDDNAGSNTLTRTAATTGIALSDYNAGAASEQIIAAGDAWVEFHVPENDGGHLLSLRTSLDGMGQPCYVATNCVDTDPGFDDLGILLVLYHDGIVYMNASQPAPAVLGTFGPYLPLERFRVRATDKHDGTAELSFSRLTDPSPCVPGTVCAEDVFYTHPTPIAYPLRVDTSLRVQSTSIANVNVVRIKPQQ
jgi:hypothetical protein